MAEEIVLLKLNDKRDRYNKNIDPKINGDEVSRRIGSEFKKGTRDTIRGLTPVQERIHLPHILGIQPTDADFPSKVKDFWSEYSLSPGPEGMRLDISTTAAKTKVKKVLPNGDLEEEEVVVQIPNNWDDYIAYQFCMNSSLVAKGNDLNNLDFFDFYLINLADENKKKVSDFEFQDKADRYYSRLTIEEKWDANRDKIDWIIELMRDKKLSVDVDNMSIVEKKMMLHEFKTKSPRLFVTTHDEDNLDIKALISKCVSNRVLLKEGNNLFFKDENIGTDMTSVAWFKNQINSGKVQVIKANLEDIISNKRQ